MAGLMSLSAILTIDLDAIAANWRALDAMTGPACETAAVVKADAYGCGAGVVGRALAKAGCRTFFVAMPEEGLALRDALGDGAAIYVFAGLDGDHARDMQRRDVRPVLNSVEQMAEAAALAARTDGLTAAMQVDTGMNRLGLEEAEAYALSRDPQSTLADGLLELDLILSHMGCADDPSHPLNADQRACFERICAASDLRIPRRSLSATAGTLLGQGYHYDMVRIGIGLYGGFPFSLGRAAVRLEAPILQIRDLAPGESVGYGALWTASRPSRIATIPVGYADGLIRALGNGAAVYLDGQPVPFAGRVSMDLITLDVTDLRCSPGDRVELLGPNQPIDALAAAAGTIGHEILTSLRGARHVRLYADSQSA